MVGAVLPAVNLTIKAGDLRGVASNGITQHAAFSGTQRAGPGPVQ